MYSHTNALYYLQIMKSTVILVSVLLLAAPMFSLPITERSGNKLQMISNLPEDSEQPIIDSELVKRDISPCKSPVL